MSKQLHYITLRAGIFSASLDPMEDPPHQISIAKPFPELGMMYADNVGLPVDVVNNKWVFKLSRIDPAVPGLTSAPIAEYRLVEES